jgi:hypothetical protein
MKILPVSTFIKNHQFHLEISENLLKIDLRKCKLSSFVRPAYICNASSAVVKFDLTEIGF